MRVAIHLIQKAGVGRELSLPSTRFRRSIGAWAAVPVTPDGRIVSREAWEQGAREWLPSESDRGFVQSLMQSLRNLNLDLADLSPPLLLLADRTRSSHEIVTQLRLLRSTLDIKLEQFERAPRNFLMDRKFR